jgi:hypothetical protein
MTRRKLRLRKISAQRPSRLKKKVKLAGQILLGLADQNLVEAYLDAYAAAIADGRGTWLPESQVTRHANMR